MRLICLRIRGLLVSAAVALAGVGAACAAVSPITQVSQIRLLPPAEASKAKPVRLQGVITYAEPARYLFFLQDASGGIYIDNVPPDSRDFHEGQLVEVKGVTEMGLFAPSVLQSQITVLGAAALPRPQAVSFDRLMSGLEDSQRVEIAGVLRSAKVDAQRLVMTIAMGQGRITATARDFTGTDHGGMVDSNVRVRGVVASQFNQHRQLTGVALDVIGLSDVEVDHAPELGPFELPVRLIGSLMNFTDDPGQWRHRVRLEGTVTHQRPGHGLFITDGNERLYVETDGMTKLSAGDRVDVAGFPAMGDFTPSLQNAISRKTGKGKPPSATHVTASDVLTGEFDKALIEIDATLMNRVKEGDRHVLALTSDNVTFDAFQERVKSPDTKAATDEMVPGSRLRLTGICVMTADHGVGQPLGFELLLRSPNDIVTLTKPSWWSFGRIIAAAGAMAGTILAALSWIFILRRRVKKQTELIEQKLASETALEKRYRDLFASATEMIYAHDVSGRLTTFNGGAEKITGYKRRDALRMNILDLVKLEQQESVRRWLSELKNHNPVLKFELQIATRSGRAATIEVSATILQHEGEVDGVECIARDVSERNRIASLERDRNDVLECLGKNEPLPLVLGRLTRLVECQRPGAICAVMLARRDRLHVAAGTHLPEEIRRILEDLPITELSLTCGAAACANRMVISANLSTDPRWFLYRDLAKALGVWSCWSVPILSAHGAVLGTVALYQPVPGVPDKEDTELLEAACRLGALAVEHSQLYNQLAYESQHDVLTGLPNRSLFEDRLRQALANARRSQLPVTLMYLDLDRFKQVNDTLGHKCGDELLQQVVVRLKASLRETDTLARIGGDEFTLVLPDVKEREQAEQVAVKMIATLAEKFTISGNAVWISASIGISQYPDDGDDSDVLQQKADLAMYHAKRNGKGKFEWYAAPMENDTEEFPASFSAIGPIACETASTIN